jgi:antitoxin VapB
MQTRTKLDKTPRGAKPRSGERVTNAKKRTLRQRLVGGRARTQKNDAPAVAARLDRLKDLARRFDALPVLDDREPDDILGYDDIGMPT